MNIVIVNGSPRKEGRTGKLSAIISKKYNIKTIDLSELTLPVYNGQEDQNELANIKMLRAELENADAMIVATPEYHGGMSGALKNALDFLGSKHFKDKPVALMAVSGGGKGGINALNNMRIVLRALYANVLSKQLVIDPTDFIQGGIALAEESSYLVNGLIQELKIYTQLTKKLNEEWSASNY
ncbi:NADPH-dependent FMN reductase [Gottfriedia solisilvae]|uniref:FMN-dependent NADPH-azoreductase n=1 Tax=Gottfriedia solisilvae TaxID=1516104 RepID=A0A8J3ASY4_9BACI|nr:NADPH-dependent FMN reductase [Gottfriedia solisilvae]GGI16307.1 FMN-dependent NADPH-azoreductase [Gottfriedia solisilvae]